MAFRIRHLLILSLVVGFVSILLPDAAEAGSKYYRLASGELRSLKGYRCGKIEGRWVPVKVVRGRGARKSGGRRAVRVCATLDTAAAAVTSITQLPSVSQMASENPSAATGVFAVDGEPPTITEIAQRDVSTLFWREGVVSSIAHGAPTTTQCREFFNGQDGESGGFAACYLAQNVGYSFQNLLQSGTSLCYMKNVAKQELIDSHALQVVSGTLPAGGIGALFNAPSTGAGRTIELRIAGISTQDGEEPRSFLRVFPASSGVMYSFKFWDCEGGTPVNVESTTISSDLLFHTVAGGTSEGMQFSSEVTAYLRQVGSEIVFDTTRSRFGAQQGINDSGSFKSELVLTPGNVIYNKSYDVFDSNARVAYAITSFSGSGGAGNLRFQAGAYKDHSSFGDNSSGTEFRSTYFAATPTNDFTPFLADVDLAADSFYASPAAPTSDLTGLTCGAPDVVLSLDFTHPALQAIREQCEGNRIDGMDFCRSDELNQAQERFVERCLN